MSARNTYNIEFWRMSPGRYRFLRQSVTLDGAGARTFEEGKISIGLIHEIFDRCFKENKLEALSDAEMIEASNRYLTPRRDAPIAQHMEFGKLIDPEGILKSMAAEGDGFVHADDNAVTYWQQKTNIDGSKRQVNIYSGCQASINLPSH